MEKRFTYSFILWALLICSASTVVGQRETYRWYFGRKAGFDFNTTPPTLLSDGPNPGGGDVEEAHASISDANGNYLFYTNGENIWNRNNIVMANGAGLNGHWSTTQCATVFPVPNSTTDYYVLTTPLTGSTLGLRWNIVDMTANTGLGDIKAPAASNKNQLMPGCPTYMMESVVSVPHFNGTDIWVIGHTADNPGTGPNEGGSFVVWLVTPTGITLNGTYTLGYAYPQNGGASRGIGIMKANSCYTRIFISYYNESSRVEGFSFSNSTGILGNWPFAAPAPLVINQYRDVSNTLTAIGSFSYGLEVSSNGRYLYNTISGETGPKVLTQYDLQAGTGTNANIINSAFRLSPVAPAGIRYGQLQMGPDGKIYHTIHEWNSNNGTTVFTRISVINDPNTANGGSNFVEIAYSWPVTAIGVGTTMGLPSFHKGFLAGRAAINSNITNLQEICLGETVTFTALTTGSPASLYEWNIDQNLNAVVDYSGAAAASINHTYGTIGIYNVELKVTDQCGYIYPTIRQVEVVPTRNTGGLATCGSPVSLDVTTLPTTGKSYVWYSDAAGTIPIGSGPSISFPAPYSGTVYVREVASVTLVNTLITPAVAGITGGISAIVNTLPASIASATTTRTTTLNVTSALLLNSFRFIARGADFACDGATASYTVNIRNTATSAVVGTYVASGSVHLGNAANAISISGNNRKQFNVSPALSLTPGQYAVEITVLSVSPANGCPTSAGPEIGLFNFSDLSAFSMTGISNGGATSATNSYITNINVSTIASPAIFQNVITPVNLRCSFMSPAIIADCPLFVSWLSFEANRLPESKVVELNWSTSSEINSNLFYILRSMDGVTFERIGQVNSSGTSTALNYYSFLDQNAPSGIVYYKIQEVGFDGQPSFSKVVNVNDGNYYSFKLLPNPGNGNFTIAGGIGQLPLTVSIFTATGQQVASFTTKSNQLLSLDYLSTGVYIVKISAEDEVQTLRYIKD